MTHSRSTMWGTGLDDVRRKAPVTHLKHHPSADQRNEWAPMKPERTSFSDVSQSSRSREWAQDLEGPNLTSTLKPEEHQLFRCPIFGCFQGLQISERQNCLEGQTTIMEVPNLPNLLYAQIIPYPLKLLFMMIIYMRIYPAKELSSKNGISIDQKLSTKGSWL